MNKSRWNPAVSTVIALILIVPLLLAAGLIVRDLVANSFQIAGQIRSARALSFNLLKYQLDEETGIRGYAATHDVLFLQPYHAGASRMTATFVALRQSVRQLALPDALGGALDAELTNSRWLRSVAAPVLNSRMKNAISIERRGKLLVDRFRTDISTIDASLATRENGTSLSASRAIDRIGVFLAVVILLVIGLAVWFILQQNRLWNRFETQRGKAEEGGRRAVVLAAAYDTEKRIADKLQEAFSQRTLPSLPALHFSATYTPATEETKVGGDWYDALELPDNRVLFAIGDVAGHGIDAAVTMSRARQALVASSMLESDPAALLTRVNAELFAQHAPMVTAVAGFANARTYEFTYSSAGHPPPILLEPGHPPRLLEFGSPPLGTAKETHFHSHRIQSVPGGMLVLYTDGAIEHSRDIFEGEKLLLDAVAMSAGRPENDPASFIHNTVFNGRAVGDDVAILTIGFTVGDASALRVSAEDSQASFAGRLARKRGEVAIARDLFAYFIGRGKAS
ncbi:MAG: SpoIIE family protein phosphatase [Candidatus Baltobacteraceae bacterium]